jgi:hypothetical protein
VSKDFKGVIPLVTSVRTALPIFIRHFTLGQKGVEKVALMV